MMLEDYNRRLKCTVIRRGIMETGEQYWFHLCAQHSIQCVIAKHLFPTPTAI